LIKTIVAKDQLPILEQNQGIEGYLHDWLIQGKRIASKGSEKYIVPEMNELLFFDEEIIKPIIQTIQHEYIQNEWTHDGFVSLKLISKIARIVNYRIIQYVHTGRKQSYLILCEKDSPEKRKYWGTYVFRLGQEKPFVIQIPRPIHDLNVFEFGVSLYERMEAQVLLISGAHKNANLDRRSDIIPRQNRHNIFNTVNQTIIRENKTHPLMVIQVRAFDYSDDHSSIHSDMIVSFASGHDDKNHFSKLENELLQTLNKDRYSWRLIDGSKATAGFEVGANPQSAYLRHSVNKEFTILWLSPETRAYHRHQLSNYSQQAQFKALGIPIVKDSLVNYLTLKSVWSPKNHNGLRILKIVESYVKQQDILILKTVKNQYRQYKYKYFLDLNTGQAFLMVYTKRKKLIGVINLLPKDFESTFLIENMNQKEKMIQRFIETRGFWLSKRK